ncbi:MAG: hypothetical protein AAF638_04245 [Pseudomonadota bacterium]
MNSNAALFEQAPFEADEFMRTASLISEARALRAESASLRQQLRERLEQNRAMRSGS